MKLSNKLIIAATISSIGISSFVRADKEEVLVEPAPVTEEPADAGVVEDSDSAAISEPDVFICELGHDKGEPVEGGEVVTLEIEEDSAPVEKDGTAIDPGCEEPIRHYQDSAVQRGEEGAVDPDVIFQTTALGSENTGGESGSTSVAAGSDERAANIETKSSGLSAVKNQKKGPVALVKKGRVFLR